MSRECSLEHSAAMVNLSCTDVCFTNAGPFHDVGKANSSGECSFLEVAPTWLADQAVTHQSHELSAATSPLVVVTGSHARRRRIQADDHCSWVLGPDICKGDDRLAHPVLSDLKSDQTIGISHLLRSAIVASASLTRRYIARLLAGGMRVNPNFS